MAEKAKSPLMAVRIEFSNSTPPKDLFISVEEYNKLMQAIIENQLKHPVKHHQTQDNPLEVVLPLDLKGVCDIIIPTQPN